VVRLLMIQIHRRGNNKSNLLTLPYHGRRKRKIRFLDKIQEVRRYRDNVVYHYDSGHYIGYNNF
jgi:hypothetical protein